MSTHLTMAPINNTQMNGPYCHIVRPSCKPENDCFIASYMTPSSTVFVDTYLTRPDRRYELTVPNAAIRAGQYQFWCKGD